MEDLDDSRSRRTNGVSDTPLLSSHSWEQIRDSFQRGGKAMEYGAVAFGVMAFRDPENKSKAAFGSAALAAKAAAVAAKEAAEFADQQAKEAKAREEAQRAEAGRRAEQARIDAERARADAQRERRFSEDLARAERYHNERVRDGSFLREYRDPPSRSQMERAGRTA